MRRCAFGDGGEVGEDETMGQVREAGRWREVTFKFVCNIDMKTALACSEKR